MNHHIEWALVAFLLGIAVHSIWAFTFLPLVACTIVVGGLVMCCWCVRKYPVGYWVGSLCLSFCVGACVFDSSLPRPMDGVLPWHGQSAVFAGRVRSMVSTGKRSTLIVAVHRADDVDIRDFGAARNVSLVTGLMGVSEGADIRFRCVLRQPSASRLNATRRESLARRGIWSECSMTSDVSVVSPPAWWDIFARLASMRRSLTERIQGVLPRDEAELISGILYGDQNLDATLKNDIRQAGLMHLVAVSGSNVTIIVVVLAAFLLALGCTRRQAFWVTTCVLGLFVVFVGASASVLRAAVMGWLVLLGRELGCCISIDRLLLVSAVALSIYNPWYVCFDAGFALSFFAMWGLLAWTPLFEKQLQMLPKFLGIRETVATTLGATLMTVPYSAWIFGQMTLAGLVTNVFALPLVPWTMLWGAVAATWGNGWGYTFIRQPAYGLAHLIIQIARLSRRMPWLNFQMHGWDIWMLLGCYLLLWQLWRVFKSYQRVVDRNVGEFRQVNDIDKK